MAPRVCSASVVPTHNRDGLFVFWAGDGNERYVLVELTGPYAAEAGLPVDPDTGRRIDEAFRIVAMRARRANAPYRPLRGFGPTHGAS